MPLTRSKSSSRKKKTKKNPFITDRPQFNAKHVTGNKGSRLRGSSTIVPRNVSNCKPHKAPYFKGSNASLKISIGFGICTGSPTSYYNYWSIFSISTPCTICSFLHSIPGIYVNVAGGACASEGAPAFIACVSVAYVQKEPTKTTRKTTLTKSTRSRCP